MLRVPGGRTMPIDKGRPLPRPGVPTGGYDGSGINPSAGSPASNPLHGDYTPNLASMVQGLSPVGQEINAAGGTPTGFDPSLGIGAGGPNMFPSAPAVPANTPGVPGTVPPASSGGVLGPQVGAGAGGGYGGLMDRLAPLIAKLPPGSPLLGIVEQLKSGTFDPSSLALGLGNGGPGGGLDLRARQDKEKRDREAGGFEGGRRGPFAGPGDGSGRRPGGIRPGPGGNGGGIGVPPVAPAPAPVTPAAPPPNYANNAFNLSTGIGGHQATGGFGGSALAGGMPKAFASQVPTSPTAPKPRW